MFRTVPLSITRSFSLYTQQCWQLVSRIRMEPSWSCSQALYKPVWHISLLCVPWKTPDDGQRNCSKHVEFYSKNKFEKLVHLVGFIIRIPLMNYFERFYLKSHFVTSDLLQNKLQTNETVCTTWYLTFNYVTPAHALIRKSYLLATFTTVGPWISPVHLHAAQN